MVKPISFSFDLKPEQNPLTVETSSVSGPDVDADANRKDSDEVVVPDTTVVDFALPVALIPCRLSH